MLRSSSPAVAVEFYLEAERTRSGAAALALVEGTVVVAASGRSQADLETLAGSLAAGVAPVDRDLYAHELRPAGQALRLASLDARVKSVRNVERDLERIFVG
jgi:hypothetical protein